MLVQILRWSLLAGAAAIVIGNYARAEEPPVARSADLDALFVAMAPATR